ncbi:hypothetical protein [Halomarina pelagica]|uniref:hypothetical protein n=1 Tax=Halomarina pelagica TaxID=2961599 RepID=UPI0020C45823|nr:hypothetical protein [Halomarina sp. BND7]
MSDSNVRDELEAKRGRNRQRRLAGIKRWVEYVKTHAPEEWGEQQNRLVDSRLGSARRSDLDVEHRRRVERVGRDRSP